MDFAVDIISNNQFLYNSLLNCSQLLFQTAIHGKENENSFKPLNLQWLSQIIIIVYLQEIEAFFIKKIFFYHLTLFMQSRHSDIHNRISYTILYINTFNKTQFPCKKKSHKLCINYQSKDSEHTFKLLGGMRGSFAASHVRTGRGFTEFRIGIASVTACRRLDVRLKSNKVRTIILFQYNLSNN